MSAQDNLGRQWSPNPSLTSARIAGILRSAGIERHSSKVGGTRVVRSGSGTSARKARTIVETSGIHVEPESSTLRTSRSDQRPAYRTDYSGRYAIGYRPGHGKISKIHSSEEIQGMLSSARDAFTKAGLQVSEHHDPNKFWVHE
jgi:hypothetical protein